MRGSQYLGARRCVDRPAIAELAAERFTVSAMIDKYVNVYRDVIGNRT